MTSAEIKYAVLVVSEDPLDGVSIEQGPIEYQGYEATGLADPSCKRFIVSDLGVVVLAQVV
jgi:hypothetical protein